MFLFLLFYNKMFFVVVSLLALAFMGYVNYKEVLHLLPGHVFHRSATARLLWETMLVAKQKEAVMEVRRQLVEAASKENLPIKLSLGKATPTFKTDIHTQLLETLRTCSLPTLKTLTELLTLKQWESRKLRNPKLMFN